MKTPLIFVLFLVVLAYFSTSNAFAAVDVAAATFGVEEASIAVMEVMGFFLSFAIAVWGVVAVLDFIKDSRD
jgi:uncharacterized PurR-regulated membrane protein YhhQ (DUF165 family)